MGADKRFGPEFLAAFDRLDIINLPERTDRRQQMQRQLRRVGLDISHPKVRLFEACRAAEAEGFHTPGAHGCFLSHLTVLKRARAEGLARVLIAEDDLDFQPLGRDARALLAPLEIQPWHLFFAGYHFPERFLADGIGLVDIGQRYKVTGCHLYAVSALAYDPLIAYLEAVQQGPSPKPQLDIAVSAFRATLPGCVTFVASPAVGIQRRSRSDIQTLKFYDRLPALRPAVDMLRQVIGRRRS